MAQFKVYRIACSCPCFLCKFMDGHDADIVHKLGGQIEKLSVDEIALRPSLKSALLAVAPSPDKIQWPTYLVMGFGQGIESLQGAVVGSYPADVFTQKISEIAV